MTSEVVLGALATWVSLLVGAALIGALGAGFLVPRVGERATQLLDASMMVALVYGLTYLFVSSHQIVSIRLPFGIGVAWAALTAALEILIGHFMLDQAWAQLLRFYKKRTGRLYFVMLLVLVVSPYMASLHSAL